MKKMFVFLLALGLGVFASCDKDDDDSFQPNNNSSVSTKVSKPTIKETARATTTTDLDITFRVTSEEQPKSVVMHYVVYSKKTDKVKRLIVQRVFLVTAMNLLAKTTTIVVSAIQVSVRAPTYIIIVKPLILLVPQRLVFLTKFLSGNLY